MGDDASVGNDDAGGHGSVRYTYALQHQHGRSSSASSTGSGGRTSRPNLTGPADCMQSMQHTGDQAPARRRHAGDNDADGRDSVRYTQSGGISASSDGSSGHVLFQAGPNWIGRLWIRAHQAFAKPAELLARPTLVLPRRPAPWQRHVCRRLRH